MGRVMIFASTTGQARAVVVMSARAVRRLLAVLVLSLGITVLGLLLFETGPWRQRQEAGEAGRESERASARIPTASEGGAVSEPGGSDREPLLEKPTEEEHAVLVDGRVVDRNRRPVAGALILASAPIFQPGTDWELELPLDSLWIEQGDDPGQISGAESGPDGTFKIRVNALEDVRLAVRHAGFVGLDRDVWVPDRSAELHLGDLVLEPGAVLRGVVLDTNGTPISGASIARVGPQAIQEGFARRWDEVLLATSEQDGSFSIDTLPFGSCQMKVEATGFATVRRQLGVDAYRLPDLELTLEPAATVTGRVLGAPEVPVFISFWMKEHDETRFVPCATDGSFTIDGLAAGMPEIRLTATRTDRPSWSADELSGSVTARPGQHDVEIRIPPPVRYHLRVYDASSRAPLTDAHLTILETAAIDAVRDRPGTVSQDSPGFYSMTVFLPWEDDRLLCISSPGHETLVGRLPYGPGQVFELEPVALRPLEKTELRVVDDRSGDPVAGAAVHAELEDVEIGETWDLVLENEPRTTMASDWEGTTAEDGTVIAFLSSSRRYSIQVDHEAYAPLRVPLAIKEHPPAELELRMLAGGSAEALCLGSDGQPLGGSWVCEELDDERESRRLRSNARSRADGRARFEHLVPGRHRIWLQGEDEGEGALVDVADGAHAMVVLRRSSKVFLHGVVTERGQPLAGATIEAWGYETSTDVAGRYAIEDQDAGERDLVVTHPRHGLVLSRRIVLEPPETRIDVDLRLVPVHGSVRDARGDPIEGARVFLGEREEDGSFEALRATVFGEQLHDGMTDALGAFRFDAVQPREGLYLVVEKGGFLPARIGPLEIPDEPEGFELTAALAGACTLEVVVEEFSMDQGWLPEIHALWLGQEDLGPADRDQRAKPSRKDRPDSGSLHFVLDTLRPGPWRIELRSLFSSDEEEALDQSEVTVLAGENPSVVLRRRGG